MLSRNDQELLAQLAAQIASGMIARMPAAQTPDVPDIVPTAVKIANAILEEAMRS